MHKKIIYTLFVTNLLIVLYNWWIGTAPYFQPGLASFLIATGKLLGLLAVCSVLLQFVLIGRAVWIERTFGLDKLALLHHKNGRLGIVFILLHPFFIALGYSINAQIPLYQQFINFILSDIDFIKAEIAVFLFLTVVVTSIYTSRLNLKFENWYFIHLIAYLAIILAWDHQLKYGSDFAGNRFFVFYWYAIYIFVFGNLLYFRFFVPVYNFFYHRFYIDHIQSENDSVTSLYIKGKNLDKFKAFAGQFIIVRFLQDGFWYESHPFSLSAKPNKDYLRLSIKSLGDFTQKIPNLKKGTRLFIEGPYGIFTKSIIQKEKVLLIAGGIGITPIRALIEELALLKIDSILLYGNKFEKEIVFREELEKLQRENTILIKHILSDQQLPGFDKGFIDLEIIKKYVRDIKDREIFLCGPPPMMRKLIQLFRELNIPEDQIHFELFSLK